MQVYTGDIHIKGEKKPIWSEFSFVDDGILLPGFDWVNRRPYVVYFPRENIHRIDIYLSDGEEDTHVNDWMDRIMGQRRSV